MFNHIQIIIFVIIFLIVLLLTIRNFNQKKIKNSIDKYLSRFNNYKTSKYFEKFIIYYFNNDNYVTNSFQLSISDYLSKYCDDKYNNFTKNELIEIGTINNSGSIVGFWNYDDSKMLTDNPIVYLGDDGYLCVIGQNLKDLLRILSIDMELFLDSDEDIFNNKELRNGALPEISPYVSGKNIPRNKSYLYWLNENTHINEVKDSNEILHSIIKPAMAKFQDDFLIKHKY